jgi:chemotaxis protein MotB
MRTSIFLGAAVIAIGVSGCVSAGKYDAAVQDASALRASIDDQQRQIQSLQHKARTSESERSTLTAKLQRSSKASQACIQELDAATAQNAELRGELERMGKDVDKLLAEKGTLSSSLDQSKKRLDELRRAQEAAEARAALFRQLALKLKKMIDAGDLSIVVRDGRMVLRLPDDVLFDSGHVEIKPSGRTALEQVASVLGQLPERRFQVAGHTDNVPIRVSGYASNWQLSTARALEVLRFLTEHGMAPERLSAAGYGEYDPIASNDSPAGKAKNRRIEITLMPRIEELVSVP